MNTTKIAFATGSRADYGILRHYLRLLDADEAIEFSVLATGALLDDRYGHAIDLIKQDGFTIDCEIDLKLDSSSDASVIRSMATALEQFGEFFESHRYDLLIILGDRYEVLSVAEAAAIHKIPILHIHGGEATFANYDEFIRHAITKMSLYHFASTEEYRNRIIQLGEAPERVYNLGALGAYNCTQIDCDKVLPEIKALPEKEYFVILFHPETLSDANPLIQIHQLLGAVSRFADNYRFVFIGSNADTHSGHIRAAVRDFVDTHSDSCVYFENVNTDSYQYLVQHSVCLIGNSSSGIIEAPSLGVYTINIGDRQKGRVRGKSVLDVICTQEAITHGIETVIRSGPQNFVNPYYQENTAQRYYETTKKLLEELPAVIKEPKCFYDLPVIN